MSNMPITITGHLTIDPEYVRVKDDLFKTKMRIASSRRFPVNNSDTGVVEWRETDSVFIDVEAWDALARNVKQSLYKGMPVIVVGSLNSSPYTDTQGIRRTKFTVRALQVGLDLNRYIIATRKLEFNQAPPGMEVPEERDIRPDRDYTQPAPASVTEDMPEDMPENLPQDTPEDTAADKQAAQAGQSGQSELVSVEAAAAAPGVEGEAPF